MSKLRPSDRLPIHPDAVEAYLTRRYGPGTRLLELAELGASTQESLKDYGYGRPLMARFAHAGLGPEERVVIRTMTADPFGHDRRADRVGSLVQDFDTFQGMPNHIQPLDVGTFDVHGQMVPMAHGEGFLVTNYVEGELYAHDLTVLQSADAATRLDVARAEALADHLAEVHSLHGAPSRWVRAIRDTIGSGEGIFGLCDSYPDDHAVATPERLENIEKACIEWRWKLRKRPARARRTHGDFHPFNLLFRDGVDFTALDCSRGAVGEPADDVTALTINYVFFALAGGAGTFEGGLRQAWDVFWARYLAQTDDHEILGLVAPFFAWRGLVVASPVWYPNIAEPVRERLFCFVERLLAGQTFAPDRIDELLS